MHRTGSGPNREHLAEYMGTFAQLVRPVISTAPDPAAAPATPPGQSGLEEFQEVGVDRRGLGGRHAVRKAVIGLERAVLHELRGQRSGVGVGNDLVVVSVDRKSTR